jgi:hypothetical protein
MKTLLKFRSAIVILLSFLTFLCVPHLKAQEISTIQEIYDFEIGDVFHIEANGFSPNSGYYSITYIEITGKYFSGNNDTVYYIRDIGYGVSSTYFPEWTVEYYTDTIYYTNLDQLINDGDIDSVYSDPEIYNGRIINYNEPFPAWNKFKYVIGCGIALDYYHNWDYDYGETKELKYYIKGNEVWGDSLLLGIDTENGVNNPSVLVYPNPFISNLNIDLTLINYGICEGLIYDSNGKQLSSFPLTVNQVNSIQLPGLHKGIFFLKIKGDLNYNQLIIKN